MAVQDTTELAHEISAMQNNFKQYVAGNTYNGVLLSISSIYTTISRGVFIPYKTMSGDNRLKGNFYGFCSSTIGEIFTISGVIFKTAFGRQACSAVPSSVMAIWADAIGGSGQIRTYAGTSFTDIGISFDVELDSWPTWADNA